MFAFYNFEIPAAIIDGRARKTAFYRINKLGWGYGLLVLSAERIASS